MVVALMSADEGHFNAGDAQTESGRTAVGRGFAS